jgi:hypothetical protein
MMTSLETLQSINLALLPKTLKSMEPNLRLKVKAKLFLLSKVQEVTRELVWPLLTSLELRKSRKNLLV